MLIYLLVQCCQFIDIVVYYWYCIAIVLLVVYFGIVLPIGILLVDLYLLIGIVCGGPWLQL